MKRFLSPRLLLDSTCFNRRLRQMQMSLLLPGLVLLAMVSACHPQKTEEPHAGGHAPFEILPKDQIAQHVATQKRINTYFHDKVTPRLKGCWESLKGSGLVTVDFDFARRDNAWAFEKAVLFHSTLPDDQNDAALECMENAVKGTSFAVDDPAAKEKQFLVSWTWPVPFPPDYEKQHIAMLQGTGGSGSGGCDGKGTPAKCYTCRYNAGRPSSSCCIKVCVGYKSCSYAHAPGGSKVIGCYNDPPIACASGGPGGLSGGVIMY